MSYVDLKHRLADLTLEAIADPEAAADWAAILARVAQADEAISGDDEGVERLIHRGVLTREGARVTLRQKFRPHRSYVQRHAGRLRSFLIKYRAAQPPAHIGRGPLWAGVLLFNEGLYFECHEWLEAAWKRTAGPEKNFLHGIVQAAAAFYHYEKGNMHGARTLLGKAMHRLDAYPSPYLGVDLDDLRVALSRWQERFAMESGPDAAPPKPIIRFTIDWTELGIRY